ncbi:MAG: NlpC/P60 family protein [Frankiales bacterium]|nr:NlpC/P60 family protein [Frankiales bacterium]
MFRETDDAANARPRISHPPVRRRVTALACAAAVTAAVLCGATPGNAAPPKNPSDSQLSAAQQAKNKVAAQVGTLSALLVQATSKLQQLTANSQLAEQKYAYAMSQLNDAKQQAVAAQAAITAAQKQLDTAHTALDNFVRNSYISPDESAGPGGLLTATDPNALLERGDYLRFVSDHQLDVMSQLDKASVAKSNADAKAKALVALQTTLTQQAQAAFNAALAARQAQQSQQAELQRQQVSYQKQLDAAKSNLATLQGQRAQYVAYQKEQARIAAEKARQAELARERAAAAAAAAEAAQRAANNNSGGSSSGGGGAVTVDNPSPGSQGGWTLAKGQAAVARALTTLGTPYAWAGGGYNGPTFGVNSPGTDGWDDSQVFGYDCSGLAMFAWASQGLYLAHYAATQYSQAGSYHPSAGNFEPGDLLFWGLPGQADIHHVAIYIGNGNVIQAPNSGSVVQITPWDQVSGDYYGATRPLT